MNLSVLLVTLLVLSWTSAEDVGDKEISPQDSDDNNSEPQLRNKASQNTEDAESELGQETPSVRVARSFPTDANRNFQWTFWKGKLPAGTVSMWNSHEQRVDYICRYSCFPGYYTPQKGAYCYYNQGAEVRRSSNFHILVNKDNFEILEWKGKMYWNTFPKNPVEVCDKNYVARNGFNIGKVQRDVQFVRRNRRYDYFEVLTVNRDIVEQKITNVKYNTKGVHVVKDKPETLRSSTITNHQCRTVTKMVTLEKSIETEKRWDVSSAVTLGVSTSVSAGIPNVADVGMEVGVEVSMRIAHGTSKVESTTHSVTVYAKVPPNHYCTITMEGVRYKTNIPYTAILTRTYRNGKITSTTVSGTYKNVEAGEIQAVAHRCMKVKDARRC